LQPYADWAPREWILLARLRARNGDAEGARAALRNLGGDASRSESLSTRMEFAAVQVLISLAAGERDAEEKLRHAMAVLDSVREEVRTHETRGWDFPANLTPKNAHHAVIDLAVAQVLFGRGDAALELLARLRDLQEWEFELFAHDPVLSRVAGDAAALESLRKATARREGLAIF